MIKGDYFLKLLKPLFSILLIGFFGLLGNSFVSANGGVYEIGLDSFNSKLNNDYSITALKGGSFITNYLGNSKGLFGLDSSYLVRRDNDGLLYGYYSGVTAIYQGNFSNYMLCDELTSTGSLNLLNCNNYSISGNVSDDLKLFFSNFFSQVVQGDYFGYDFGNGPAITLCWSSRSVGKTMCFIRNTINYPFFNNKSYNGLTFLNFQTSLIGKAPGQQGYNGQYNGSTDGSVVVDPDSTYTGDYTYTECTFSNVYNQLNNMGYNPYLCYGGLDNYDNLVLTGIYNAQPGTGVNMLGIYTHSSHNLDKQSWFNYWNTSYINQYVSSRDIWYDEPASLYFLFKYYNEYGGNNLEFLSVWEYCNIDWIVNNMSTMPDSKYTGSNFQYVCDIIKAKDIMNGIGGNDGENVEGLNWDGVGVLSGGKTYNDPGQFITDMFTKIKSYIPTDGSDVGLGFLPTYIITFMLFLILFRFLSH